jgi:hypothetical protein
MRKPIQSRSGTVIVRDVLLLILPTLLSCSLIHYGKTKATAEAGVEQFRREFAAGHYHEIYEQADQQFKDADSESHFAALLAAEQSKLGAVQQSTEVGASLSASTNDGTVMTLTYDTDFKEGKGKETFVYRIAGDQAALDGYHIESLALITR